MADKMLDKIALLLNQAENASNEAEAEAFMKKAQELATTEAIDLAMARQHTAKKEQREQPIHKTIWITDPEGRQKGLKYLTELFMTVGRQNSLRFNIAHNSSYVVAFGLPSDIEVTEVLYASLLVQMVEAANAYLKSGVYKQDMVEVYQEPCARNDWMGRYITKPVDGRVARASFYEGFTRRVGNRLFDAKQEAMERWNRDQEAYPVHEPEDPELKAALEAADEYERVHGDQRHVHLGGQAWRNAEERKPNAELVLKNKELEVTDYYKEHSKAKGSYNPSKSSGSSWAAKSAGREAGDRARLGIHKAIS